MVSTKSGRPRQRPSPLETCAGTVAEVGLPSGTPQEDGTGTVGRRRSGETPGVAIRRWCERRRRRLPQWRPHPPVSPFPNGEGGRKQRCFLRHILRLLPEGQRPSGLLYSRNRLAVNANQRGSVAPTPTTSDGSQRRRPARPDPLSSGPTPGKRPPLRKACAETVASGIAVWCGIGRWGRCPIGSGLPCRTTTVRCQRRRPVLQCAGPQVAGRRRQEMQ